MRHYGGYIELPCKHGYIELTIDSKLNMLEFENDFERMLEFCGHQYVVLNLYRAEILLLCL